MRHFIDTRGQPATVKFVEPIERVYGGSLLKDYDRCIRLQESGKATIDTIQIDTFRRGHIFIMQPSKSPWAGFWVCHNFDKSLWIQLSKGTTEEEAIDRYESQKFDRVKGIHKDSPMTEKRIANAIAANEAQQIKHYGTTTLDFLETLPPEIAAKVRLCQQTKESIETLEGVLND